MKLVRPIDFVFLVSLAKFAGSFIIVKATGGVGPCGPASTAARNGWGHRVGLGVVSQRVASGKLNTFSIKLTTGYPLATQWLVLLC
jgi:hypothetical protein